MFNTYKNIFKVLKIWLLSIVYLSTGGFTQLSDGSLIEYRSPWKLTKRYRKCMFSILTISTHMLLGYLYLSPLPTCQWPSPHQTPAQATLCPPYPWISLARLACMARPVWPLCRGGQVWTGLTNHTLACIWIIPNCQHDVQTLATLKSTLRSGISLKPVISLFSSEWITPVISPHAI